MKKYFIILKNEQKGPFDLEAIKQMSISRNTEVWTEGYEDWVQAKDIPELAAILPPPIKKKEPVKPITPPPRPKKRQPDPVKKVEVKPIQKKSVSSPKSSVNVPALAIAVGMALLFIIVVFRSSSTSTTPDYYETSKINKVIDNRETNRDKEHVKKNIGSYVSAKLNDYKKDPIGGGIWDLNVTVKNTSKYTMDRVRVKIHYYTTLGELYKKEYVYANNIRPNGWVYVSAPNSPKGTRADCVITDVESVELNSY